MCRRWISVKDKLPEIGSVVLLYQHYPKETMFNCRADPLEMTFVRIGGLRYDNLFVDYQNMYGEPLKYINYWMPLPQSPKEIERNEYH